ncbi:MAG: hypothetical protein JNM26_09940 [Ideonella sp.]|nr:hypothetical protein [Ideonella sp.]
MTAAAVLATLTARDIALFLDAGRLRYSAPPGALTDADREAIAEHRQEIVAALLAGAEPGPAPTDPDPAAHCPACGSPSFWRSPSSPAWACSYCRPRDRSRAEAVESLTLDSGRWRAGTRPPADPDDDPPEPHALDPVAPRPPRPDDGRVQVAGGAWRTQAAHEAIRAFYAHHWTCAACIRAGRGYGTRCEAGERLHALTRGTEK